MVGTQDSTDGSPRSRPEMNRFVTVDLNGWLDHLVDESGKARTLGFRSCLYKYDDTWLLGAQALAAARETRTDEPLVDALDAQTSAAGHGSSPAEEREALPAALWQLAADATRRADGPVHLALVIPDGQFLGSVSVRRDTGKTALETLHESLDRSRPRSLTRSRVELVWRSVAALKAVVDQRKLGDRPGAVLVISINRRTFWTVLEFRPWSLTGKGDGPLHIVRSPAMDDCEESEAWTAQRVRTVRRALADQGNDHLGEIGRWTRWVEILATGMGTESLAKLGIDANAIEHRSWPMSCGGWEVWPDTPPINLVTNPLPVALRRRIEGFRNGNEGVPLAIVVESPAGLEMTAAFEASVRQLAKGVPIFRAIGADTAWAAAQLADVLGRDPNAPAWLDKVPGIELEVRTRTKDGTTRATEWLTVVPGNEAIPAGETYHTHPDPARRVTLAPGIEHVHLHLRRGRDGEWDERYVGPESGHTIRPSDHVRIVEPLARVRPLSDEARIEIIEHLSDGRVEALAGSRSSMRWREMSGEEPAAFRSIPELYIFEPSEEAWNDLKRLLHQVVAAAKSSATINPRLKDDLYKCTQKQWQERKFPLGSDGEPPRTTDSQQHRDDQRLLAASTEALLADLERSIQSDERTRTRVANRLHLPLTWLFTGCPDRAVEILLNAAENPEGPAGRALHMENDFSAWSIYSGVGRAARSEDALRGIFDTLIRAWEDEGRQRQDKYLLAAVTHPMARRVAVRRVLNEGRERFERVKRFLDRQLANLLEGIHDPRPQSNARHQANPSLELRYVTMGYRGLCQVRYANPDWFDVEGEDARELFTKLRDAQSIGRPFERDLVERTAPYLIGKGENPSMPGGF